ncbi:MAG: Integral membrane protein MviN [Candidatus Nomurabacteria bacterium GW2011_GWE1_32_28]|uniref:Integral membrane protein MviN n=1 Tax=Candidatus Nomurabacteria bacterium GW2011_GWF1_31_48 TaxID=1618767 RepID=A0A0G0AUX8_9BACT|nr:MAG: Integral membrane protein MviN [Candidatus Nomurabacteria bacterium GW2011_GWF2_30_133]KKP29105.1 MAG: Integral membrane protein MviN [Candidatus Nomurabacteria bacterium GW2011_GWE2_31_40]KKP30485.1 MAG: Integral membrane protein MviN [Candidatus Nomurabacteria bacterium GW2011_GWF1_31_48]KKP34970.1 MAG: Integral membrane protein MviN [Candidatus Nomurabacteria bacterium GW2011_GWE1_32_28]HAS80662.1 hypothetical protein [Candidatus Nomurabacteria bacterium]
MQRILKIFSKEYVNINQAALLLGSFTFLSQILALFRDRFIAHFIGPSASLDAYYAAFRVPDLIFISIASLASITVLIPFIVGKMKDEKVTEEARKLLSDVFTVFFITMIVISVIAFFLMPYIISIVTPGFSLDMQTKVVLFSRIMLLSPILMGLSNLFGTITQLFRKFFIYSLSPIFYNIGIILGIVFLYPIFGIYGLVFGVVIGAFMHFLIQVFASFGCGFKPKFSFDIDFKEIKKIALTSLPRTLGLSFNNIALISIIAFASYLSSGSISIFNLSFNLQSVPLNIIGISYAVAAFPTLVKSFDRGIKSEFREHLKSTARQIVFWSLPVIFLFIVLRAQIVRVILGSGYFSWDNTRLVAASLAIFSVSVLSQGMVALLSRVYYATGETKRPLYVNLFSSILIIVLAYLFIKIFENIPLFHYFIESILKVENIPGTEVLMLPLAYSSGTIINSILHWYFIRRDFMNHESFITKTFFQSLGASFLIGVITYLSLNIFSPIFGMDTFLGVFLQGFISGILGICSGIIILYILRNEEFLSLIQTLKTKFWRSDILVSPQEEL